MDGIKVVYQDDNVVAINKPAGLLVHSSEYQRKKEPTLVDWLLKKLPQVKKVGDDRKHRPGIVHRLDKDTSGIMLVPLNQTYFSYLKKLFQEKKISKTYLAIVKGEVKNKEGKIDKPIGIKSGTTRRTVFSDKMSKEAVTTYKLIKTFEHEGILMSLLYVMPLTGRTHQIRVHLNFIGYPVIGDKMYGGKTVTALAPRQMLHCYSLELELEPGKSIKLEAEPPADFIKISGKIL
jgi:23S rRNA pseudouridine1911/1915/1917 synthase